MQIRLIAKPSVKSNVIGGSKFLKLSNWACLEHSDQNLPVFSRSGSKRVLFIFFRRELPHCLVECQFCLMKQNKMHGFTLVDQDGIGLMIFKNFVDQVWIEYNFCGSGLDLDWKISQSVHLWPERNLNQFSQIKCSNLETELNFMKKFKQNYQIQI